MSLEERIARLEEEIAETKEEANKAKAEGNERKWEILTNKEIELRKEKNLLLEQAKPSAEKAGPSQKRQKIELSYAPKPSDATEKTVQNKWITGSICGHESLFRAQLDIYKESIPADARKFAQKILNYVRPESLFTLLEKNNEKNCTAIFSAMFQQFQEKYQPTDSEVLWLHQFEEIDCVGVKKLINPTTSDVYYEPKVFFEFSLPSTAGKDKPSQLLCYINNSDISLVHSSHWPVCLGIVVQLYGVSFGFTLQGFYPVLDDDGKYKNARVSLFKGVWDVANVSRLAVTIQNFISIDQSQFELPMFLDKSYHLGNVLFLEINNIKTVFKVFDGRYRHSPLKRNYERSIQFIPGCDVFFQQDELTIISYPFIEGDHYPANSLQIISLLNKLIEFHSENYVLSDIRASNIVFGKDSDSCFIDMDYCGLVGQVFYPETFRLEISDGKRHTAVLPGAKARKEHDSFSLAATLKIFELKDESVQRFWGDVLSAIQNNLLSDALRSLQMHESFEFKPITEEELFTVKFHGTGISPHKK